MVWKMLCSTESSPFFFRLSKQQAACSYLGKRVCCSLKNTKETERQQLGAQEHTICQGERHKRHRSHKVVGCTHVPCRSARRGSRIWLGTQTWISKLHLLVSPPPYRKVCPKAWAARSSTDICFFPARCIHPKRCRIGQ